MLKSESLGKMATTIPSLDFLACGGMFYVTTGSMGVLETTSVNGAGDDAAWLNNKDRLEY